MDCHLCVYPGRGGCLDRSEGSLDALVESARTVAMRNSIDLGTIIRIKGRQDQVYLSANLQWTIRTRKRRFGLRPPIQNCYDMNIRADNLEDNIDDERRTDRGITIQSISIS